MKKSNITINPIDSKIIISKAFYKKASIYGTNEYNELRKAKNENQGFEIEFKTVEKKNYHGLTFEVMEEYIRTQPNSERLLANLAAVQRVAKAKNSLYPLTKKWFLKTFPAYKINEVAEQETENLATQLAAEAEKKATTGIETIINTAA